MLFVLGLAVSAAAIVAAYDLMTRMWRSLGGDGTQWLTPSLGRFAAGAAGMAGPAWLTATYVSGWLGPPLGSKVGMIAAALVGVAVYVAIQALWLTPEVSWLSGGLSQMRRKARRTLAELGPAELELVHGRAARCERPPRTAVG